MVKYLLIALLLCVCFSQQNIIEYGAIPNEDTLHAQVINAKAINDAIIKANSS